jgi:type I restriction enzyme S subunit
MIDERLRHYIHKVICSPYAQKYINQKAFGDKGGFSGTRCKMMPIPLPPLEEQKRIVERIDSIYASI